jgi:hypothetical protein
MGIDPINKISIIIRILFAFTLFQQTSGVENQIRTQVMEWLDKFNIQIKV